MNALQVKARAKVIFGKKFNYPALPLRSIGRHCFAWSIREAKRQLAAEAAVAAIPAAEKASRAASIRAELELVPYIESWTQAVARRAELQAELTRLAA